METTTVKTLKEAVEEAQFKWLQGKIFRSRWSHIRASGIDDPCNRRLYYCLTCGELADEVTTDLVSIFQEGNDQEVVVRRFLSELGFEVKKSGFTEFWPEHNISGGVDGVLEYEGQKYIAEIKTVSEYAWDKLQTIENFSDGYYKKWFGQMMTYLLLFNFEKGVFILKRKQAKEVRIIEVALNYEYAEGLLKKAELVNEALKKGIEPDFLKNNPVECKRCPFFGKVCNPPLDFGKTAMIEDPVIEQKLVRREELYTLSKEYEKLDKEVKERFKDIPMALCGSYAITGKAGTIKRAAQEAKEIPTWRVSIERLDKKEE